MLRTVVVMDRSDRILTTYSIVLEIEDFAPDDEAFIVEAQRRARKEKLSRDCDIQILKFVLFSDAV